MLLVVPRPPEPGEPRWPTLGPQVCDWIETFCVHGPGDMLGKPVHLSAEQRGVIYSVYELYPAWHDRAGSRRVTRAAISVRRGWGKTELWAFVGLAELHPEGPVRFGGWDDLGEPVGIAPTSPLLLIFSASQEQADDTGYAAMRQIVEHGPLANELYAVGEHISRPDGTGQAKTLAAAPSTNEGRLASWAWFNETHRATRPGVKEAYKVIRDGFPKRMYGDPWSAEDTTAFVPGEGSLAEATYGYADKVHKGKAKGTGLFFFHRQAGNEHDLTTREGRDAAIREATGPAAITYTDVDRINDQWDEDDADVLRLEQVWLNRPVQASAQAVNIAGWDLGAVDEPVIPDPGRAITIGFDGSDKRDTTWIVGCDVETGYQWPIATWDPSELPDGEVPADEVESAFEDAFATWRVVKVFGDPSYFRQMLSVLAGKHGKSVVVLIWPNQLRRCAFAIDRWLKAVKDGAVPHAGDPRMRAQLANARRQPVEVRDPESTRKLCLLSKAYDDSPDCKDAADASWMAWDARFYALEDLKDETNDSWAY